MDVLRVSRMSWIPAAVHVGSIMWKMNELPFPHGHPTKGCIELVVQNACSWTVRFSQPALTSHIKVQRKIYGNLRDTSYVHR